MYTFLIIILVALFIFCCWGFTLSLKRRNKIKNLQSSADYSFETKRGAYTFNYLVKAFDNNGGKIVKIIVAPYIGFSDLKNFRTNSLRSFSAEINSKTPKQYIERGDNMDATLTIELTPDYLTDGVLNANFKVSTSWHFSEIVNDTLEFNFNK